MRASEGWGAREKVYSSAPKMREFNQISGAQGTRRRCNGSARQGSRGGNARRFTRFPLVLLVPKLHLGTHLGAKFYFAGGGVGGPWRHRPSQTSCPRTPPSMRSAASLPKTFPPRNFRGRATRCWVIMITTWSRRGSARRSSPMPPPNPARAGRCPPNGIALIFPTTARWSRSSRSTATIKRRRRRSSP
ncbi:MAG: hypothetical protein QOE70_5073 [Chthoniobacter sp.]|nr:hypothetical protein [Chthoniobacter sp.]